MTVLNDNEIRELGDFGMIKPFEPQQVRRVTTAFKDERVISYGTSSFGYDARLANEFKTCVGGVLDPKQPELATWREWTQEGRVVIPPHGVLLARTVEWFKVPRDVIAICVGKSTYARDFLIVNVTPLEPGWEGHVTLELSNTTDLPSVVYVGEGICQFVFLTGNPPSTSYADRGGKYQGQTGVTLARV